MDSPWRIQLLGGLRAEQGERVVTRFRMQKAAALLGYLAFYRQRTHPREVLIEILWPECEVEVGRHRLSMALSALRQQLESSGAFGGRVIVSDHFAVGLDPAAVTTDVERFTSLVAAGLASAPAPVEGGIPDSPACLLAEAVELYHGGLLPGFYEEWIAPEQQRLAELFFQALHQLMAHHEGQGNINRALYYALRAVSADRLREEAHRELMRLYAVAGQPDAALRQYRELERILQQEFGDTPSDATRALAEEIGRSGVQAFGRSSDERPLTTIHRSPTEDQNIAPEHAVTPSPPPSHPLGGPPRPPNARAGTLPLTRSFDLESPGGAVPLDSPFYVVRPRDGEFRAAIARRDSIVLVKGAQGVGKTSLLARGMQQARQAGAQIVLTDLRKLTASHLESAETFFLTLAEWIGDQLDLDVFPDGVWHPRRAPSVNLERYLKREVLRAVSGPIVWGLDEVDLLFEYDFGSELFHLFRAWHNERALDPDGPWMRLTLAIAYATEAHLFITDLNKSPFNVGTRVTLDDFTLEQVADLNRRHGAPLKDAADVGRFYRLVGGHPDLVRRGLHEVATHGTDIAVLEARASSGEWIFGDHLQRIRVLLARDAELCDVLRGVLQGRPCPTPESFYRLRSAGIVTGDTPADARPRCPLYATYLERHLP